MSNNVKFGSNQFEQSIKAAYENSAAVLNAFEDLSTYVDSIELFDNDIHGLCFIINIDDNHYSECWLYELNDGNFQLSYDNFTSYCYADYEPYGETSVKRYEEHEEFITHDHFNSKAEDLVGAFNDVVNDFKK